MSITTSIVFENESERDYIKRLIKVRRNLQGLVETGALASVPDMIALAITAIQGNTPKQTTITPTGVVFETAAIPQFIEDVLNGGSYPNPEDCTKEERDILYNSMFQEYYKRYISTKDDKSRGLLRGIIAEFIEHNFPMLEKDTK